MTGIAFIGGIVLGAAIIGTLWYLVAKKRNAQFEAILQRNYVKEYDNVIPFIRDEVKAIPKDELASTFNKAMKERKDEN